MSISPLRILLVEDDELFRLGLRVRLQMESGLEIVAEAEDGETAVDRSYFYSLVKSVIFASRDGSKSRLSALGKKGIYN